MAAAYHLTRQCPGTSFLVLEAQESFGGTWLTHRYPGIRSDSDLYTFGYRFKPWTGPPIATAAEILRYMGEVIEENDLAAHIRYRHRICTARWSSEENLWTVEAVRSDTGETVRIAANFLWMCQGYYRHAEGYTPAWRGMEDFKGRVVHPQTWPEDLDYAGKDVVVIGSGATAATLIPAIAGGSGHVTMLQRSPTYYITGRNAIVIADELRALDIDEAWIHEIVRKKILHEQAVFTRRSISEPEAVKQELLSGVRACLGPDFDVETHFTPRYRPWRQRIAFIPDADLFQAIRAGKAFGRRQTPRICRYGHLSRNDVHRRAQSGLGLRILPRQLDAALGSGGRFHVPAAQSHAGEGCAQGHADAAPRGPGHALAALDRSGKLQPRLSHARHAAAAEARR